MPISNNINAIIFDIGNVLIDIDYEVMISRFTEMANIDFHQIVTFAHQHPVFDQYEKGQISSAEFRAALRRYLRPEAQDAEINSAWNSMLIHYPPAKFELLKRLRGQYKLFALSNINELHADAIEADVRARFGGGMRSYFDRAYYSHEMGHRKPEKEIYETVLENENLDPSRTLFIDDKAENIASAASLGIQVHHLTDREALLGLFTS